MQQILRTPFLERSTKLVINHHLHSVNYMYPSAKIEVSCLLSPVSEFAMLTFLISSTQIKLKISKYMHLKERKKRKVSLFCLIIESIFMIVLVPRMRIIRSLINIYKYLRKSEKKSNSRETLISFSLFWMHFIPCNSKQ